MTDIQAMHRFQIAELEAQIADFESAVAQLGSGAGAADPLIGEFRARLDSLKSELARLQPSVETS